MKRFLSLITVLALLLAVTCSASAAEEFTDSVSYKGAPDVVMILDDEGKNAVGIVSKLNGDVLDHIYEDCIVITPVSEAATSDRIPDAAEKLLLEVYAALLDGSMTIPYEKLNANLKSNQMVIRDLFDLSWLCDEHPDMVAPEGIVVELTFDLNVKADTKVYCMTYYNNEWQPIVSTENNGDGTVTCVFEHFCPVVFCVQTSATPGPTGDGSGAQVVLWIALMVVSATALTVLLVANRRKKV